MYQQAVSLVTSRDLVVAGTTIPAGTELSSSQLASITTLQPLLSKGWIVANPDPYARRTQDGTPQPTYVNPGSYRTLVDALVAEESTPAPDPDPAPEGDGE